jgi:ABC-type branched-subunit amino acid transport system ATPase component
MRIKSIEASNFKSLVDFKLELAKFSCLIGLNGSGKSTVLQFIDFVSQLVSGDMEGWLSQRKWRASDVKSNLTKKANVDFCVYLSDANDEPAGRWEATYSPSRNQCTRERIDLLNFLLETRKDSVEVTDLTTGNAKEYEIAFYYEGSILSALKEELLPPAMLECKRFFQGIKSLDLLAPEYLRQRTRESSGTIGRGGENMSAFLHEMSDQKRLELLKSLREVYPRLQGVYAKPLRSGWKQLEISEAYDGPESGFFPSITTEARHVNDGMLRLMAILAELTSENQFVLFDEIENGINPELIKFVIDRLVGARQQVLVATHSPMILNYLDDDTARRAVIYLYKTPLGYTRAIPFFPIPSIAEKLDVMGPGEAFVDTSLTDLGAEIDSISGEK